MTSMLVAGMGAPPRLRLEIAGAGEGEVSSHVLIGAAVHAEFVVGVGRIGGAGQAALSGRRGNPDELLIRVGKGSGRSSRLLTTLKTAMFAPMPRARSRMATTVKPRSRLSERTV
jgi:hypothetical protein